jgi:CO/xanthine dehydrogenase Mo-binding subunit
MLALGMKHLGQGRKIIDGLEKITGRARYVADLEVQGLTHARVVLSPYPHARIVGFDKAAALAVPGVIAVLTADDIPERSPANSRPMAILARGETIFAGQPVAVVVAHSVNAASDAAALLGVEYEPLDVVPDAMWALEAGSALVWPNGLPGSGSEMASIHGGDAGEASASLGANLADQKTWKRGDLEAGFAGSSVVIERTYTNAWVHQAYLEPSAVIAEPDGRGGLTVYACTQGQFVVRDEVAKITGLRPRDVKVIPMTVGGGFGAKYGMLEPLVAAVAFKLQKPVKLVLSRSEDMQTTMPSPGTQITLKTGCSSDGRIMAIRAHIVLDAGAFPFGFLSVVANALGGMYKCDNLEITADEVFTHKSGAGAYRAPGVPQALFALESNIDEMALALGFDPLEFRFQNVVEADDPTGVNRKWPESNLRACLDRVREHPTWQRRGSRVGEGVGLAIGAWPGAYSPAGAVCRVEPDGTVRLHVGSVDISGVHSSLVLIAAETLNVNPDHVQIVQGTTDSGPVAPASGGSQITISLSGAVSSASEGVRDQLLNLAAEHFEVHRDDLELEDGFVRVKGVPEQYIGIGRLAEQAESKAGGPGPIMAEGRSAIKVGAPGFVAHLVRVRVNLETGHVRPLEYVAVQDVGFALNPTLIEGQMQGGAVQGLGFGLFENLRFEDGSLASANFLEYQFPRAQDVPNIETIMLELPSRHGPFGARVVGEPPITAGAAAVANAIRDAVGVRVTELPVTPETIWRALQARGETNTR